MSADQLTKTDQQSQDPNAPKNHERFLYKPSVVIGLLFLVTMFLGLPLLWLSPHFSTLTKILITLLNVAYSAFALWAFYALMVWCYGRISGALSGF